MRNHHATGLKIATWTPKYFGKPFPLNSLPLHQEIQLESLFHKEKALHQFYAENCCKIKFSEPELISDDPKHSGNLC